MAIRTPPHEPVYNSHCAPVPRDPPTTVKSTGLIEHKVVEEAESEVGLVESVSTVMVVLTQLVVLQEPLAKA